ncbi:MAG: OmpA family protein [Firmicutes bacterium]|nr:OmpA family protein [Bacillota bacterium]
MKKIFGVLLLGTALSLTAQEGQNWVTAQVGGAFRSSDNIYDNGFAYGLGAGHWFTNRWGLDLKALRADQELKSGASSAGREYIGLGSLLFNFRPGADNWYPYLAAGLGGSRLHPPILDKDSTRLNYHLGAGLLGHFGKLAVQFDVKAVRSDLPIARNTDLLGLVGLGYTWGGVKKVLPPPPPPPPPPAPEPAPAPAPPPPPPPPPPPAPEPPKPQPPPPPPPPAKIVLDEATLHFANGKALLDAQAISAIQKSAEELKRVPGDYSLTVSGYTSSVGGRAFNQALSKRRADAVAKVLVDSGIASSKITTVGKGPDNPIGDNKTKEGQAKNRRVEIDIKTKANVEIREIKTDLVGVDTGKAEKAAPAKKVVKKKAAPKK